MELTGLFFPEGPVVQVQNFVKQKQVLNDENPSTEYDGPLVVLVSHLSASAAEITAAALQDYGRAVVVGDKSTHGKGTVQTLIEMNRFPGMPDEAGLMKYTISKFYRIAGGTTQKQGVTPDIILPSIYDYMELGEANLPRSLDPDSIQPADYKTMHRVNEPILDVLRNKSKQRIEQDRDFQYIQDDIERYLEIKQRKTISLNEEKRIPEKAEDKERNEKRDEERKARRYPGLKIYRITMDQVRDESPAELMFDGDNPEHYVVEEDTDADEETEGELPAIQEDSYVGDEQDEIDKRLDAYTREGVRILRDYIDALKADDKEPGNRLTASSNR